MGLFKADLYRFFLAGFAAGAIMIVASVDGGPAAFLGDSVVPPAQAASVQ